MATPSASSSIPFPDRFNLAAKYIDQTYGDLEQNQTLTNDTKLILYALRQQAEIGPCKESAPYMWNVTARYKHGAWQGLGNMIKPEAMVHYVRQVETLDADWVSKVLPSSSSTDESDEPSTSISNENTKNEDQQQKPLPSNSSDAPSSTHSSTKRSSRKQQQRQNNYSNNNDPNFNLIVNDEENFDCDNIVDVSNISDAQLVQFVNSQISEGKELNEKKTKSNQVTAYVPSTVARGLVNEILKLRKSLVMAQATAAAASTSSNASSSNYSSLQQYQVMMMAAAVSTPSVESRYYSSSTVPKTSVPVVTEHQKEKPRKEETEVATTSEISQQLEEQSMKKEEEVSTTLEPAHAEETKEEDPGVKEEEKQQPEPEQQQKKGWFSWLF